jgi:hypothetical protein
MNPKNIALISLRGLAALFRLRGLVDQASALEKIAAGIQSGINVDEHMALVAEALKTDAPNDWANVTARINAEGDKFQTPSPTA